MQPFIVPTTFTASDKYSKTLDYMGAKTKGFASGLHSVSTTSENLFRKLTPGLSDVSKQFLSVASTAAITAGIIAGGRWSVDEIMKYEDELANLQAVTGASDEQFGVFKESINKVASETKKSSVIVAQAFTAIANNQPALLKDADALGLVVKQSILLAKAAKIELQPAGEAVTQTLNQYGKGAEYAAKLVSVLAAGSVAGSSEIADTTEAIKQFGTVASVAGVKIDESVALIELGSKFDKGAEAGVKFRNILLNMTGAKVLDKLALKDLKKAGVNLDVVSNKSLPLNDRLLEMSKIANNTNAIMHVFGKENAAMAAGVLTNAGTFAIMQEQVNKTGEAERMAAKNSDTLRNRANEAKDAFITYLTSSDNLSSGLNQAKNIMAYVSTHIDTIVSAGINLLKFFALWKAANIAMKVSTIALNAVNNAFYIVDMIKYVASTQGMTFATAAWAVAQESLNAAISTSALAMLGATAAVGALAYAFYNLYKNWDSVSTSLSTGASGIMRDFSSAWMGIEDSFLSMVENIKLGWSSLQSSLGIISAKDHINNMVNIKKEQDLRTKNILQNSAQNKVSDIKEGKQLLNAYVRDAKKNDSNYATSDFSKIENVLNEKNVSNKDIVTATKPAVSTKLAQNESMINVNSTNKNSATLTIVNDSDNTAKTEGLNKTTNILPKTTSTVLMSGK